MRSSGKNLQNPVSSHALICVEFIVNCDVIFVHLSDIYVQFLHPHICHILNLLDITSVAISIHCLIIRTNKFVVISAQSQTFVTTAPLCTDVQSRVIHLLNCNNIFLANHISVCMWRQVLVHSLSLLSQQISS